MNEDEKICPYCGQVIKKVAVKCKYCKTFLQEKQANTTTIKNNSSMGIKLSLILLGVLLLVGTVIYFNNQQISALFHKNANVAEESNRGNQTAKLIFEIVSNQPKSIIPKNLTDEAECKLRVILKDYNTDIVKTPKKNELTVVFYDNYTQNDYKRIIEKINEPLLIFGDNRLSSKDLKKVSFYKDKYEHKEHLSIKFNEAGSKQLTDITSKLIRKSLPFIYNGKVIASPTIMEAITGGEAVISLDNSVSIDKKEFIKSIKADMDGVSFSLQRPVFDMITSINNAEEQFKKYLEAKHSTDETCKAFVKLFDELIAFRSYIYEQRDKFGLSPLETMTINKIELKNEGFNEKTKQRINRIISPATSLVYLETSQDYFAVVQINYDYLLSRYSQYLIPEWREYLSLEKEESIDYSIGAWYDDEHWGDIYFKWVNKWEDFLKRYPDFYRKEEIKENIEGIKETF
ncbi:MAG: hypothetical protein NC191_02120 [Muribaculaceae bacterium]|nr:hypothetical protein [Muribaculaceae bacterium]